MLQPEIKEWMREYSKSKINSERFNQSYDALSKLIEINSNSSYDFEKAVMNMYKASDFEKKEAILDFSNLEIFVKATYYSLYRKNDPRDMIEGIALYGMLYDYFHLLSPNIPLSTANPDRMNGIDADFVRVYQFRNEKAHNPNINVSFENINKVLKSTIICYLEFAYSIKGDIFKHYNRYQAANNFNVKEYLQKLVENYGSAPFAKSFFLNTKWYDKKHPSSQYDVAMILDQKPLQLKLLGEAGSGKTTALKKIENILAKRKLQKPESPLIPVYVNLGNISLSDNIIEDSIKSILETDKKTVNALIDGEELCLLLDGYNEILDLDTQRKFAGELDVLIMKHPNLSVILTDRAVTTPRIKVMNQTKCLYLLALTNEDKLLYFEKNASNPNIFKLIKNNQQQLQFLNTPLKLKNYLEVVEKYSSLPDNFTEQYIEMIFEREMNEKKDMNLNYLPSFLEALALTERPFSKIKALTTFAKVKTALGYTIPDTVVCLDLAVNMGILCVDNDKFDFAEEEYADYFLIKAAESGIDEVL